MKIQNIYYSSHFAATFKKLPQRVKKSAIEKEILFRDDCFDPRLKTHKLHGALNHYWAFSINYSYRIVFEFMNEGKVGFVDIGAHGIYR